VSAARGIADDVERGLEAAFARIEAFLGERHDELIEFAAELVAAPSPNPPGDETRVAELVCGRLRALGAADVAIAAAEPGRPNVLATFGATRPGQVLVLNGHLDTKPPGDLAAWETPPFEPVVRDGVLTGLGAADMKGAVAAITYAAGAVAAAGVKGTLRVVFTADEEAGGAFGSRWLAEQGLLEGDACVIAEPSGVRREWESIRLVSRGVAIFRVSVRGTQMHSSLADELESVNATLEMASLMLRMSAAAPTMLRYSPHALTEGGPTFNIGLLVRSGVGYGVYPGHAEFLCDVRALPGMTAEEIEADVRAFIRTVEAEDPDLQTEFEMLNWTPPAEIEAAHAIVEALQEAAETVLGAPPPLGVFPGGTDAPYFSGVAGIPTVPAFGPGLLPCAHAPNESIAVASIVQAARIYALAAARFLDA
jgi:acetylornithine deacetylase